MANHYRILTVVSSKDRHTVRSFLDGLRSGGWSAHLTVPVQAWRAILFPDIRILTNEGVIEVDDCRHLPQFAHDNPFDQANAVIGTDSSYPSFTRPQPADHIAVLLGESRGGVPDKWFQEVIENNYQAGLRFFARCFDVGDIPWDEIERSAIFYSSDDTEHFAALTEEPAMDGETVAS